MKRQGIMRKFWIEENGSFLACIVIHFLEFRKDLVKPFETFRVSNKVISPFVFSTVKFDEKLKVETN